MPHHSKPDLQPYRAPAYRYNSSVVGQSMTFPGELDSDEASDEQLQQDDSRAHMHVIVERVTDILHTINSRSAQSTTLAQLYKERHGETLPCYWVYHLQSCGRFSLKQLETGFNVTMLSTTSTRKVTVERVVEKPVSQPDQPGSSAGSGVKKRVSFCEEQRVHMYSPTPHEEQLTDEEFMSDSGALAIMRNANPKQLSAMLCRHEPSYTSTMRITHVINPGRFWAIDLELQADENRLHDALSAIELPSAEECGPWVQEELQVGGLYLSRAYGELERVIVTGRRAGKVVVHSIDLGTNAVVTVNDVMYCPPDLVKISALAVPLCLSGKGAMKHCEFSRTELDNFKHEFSDRVVDVAFEEDVNDRRGKATMERNKFSVSEIKVRQEDMKDGADVFHEDNRTYLKPDCPQFLNAAGKEIIFDEVDPPSDEDADENMVFNEVATKPANEHAVPQQPAARRAFVPFWRSCAVKMVEKATQVSPPKVGVLEENVPPKEAGDVVDSAPKMPVAESAVLKPKNWNEAAAYKPNMGEMHNNSDNKRSREMTYRPKPQPSTSLQQFQKKINDRGDDAVAREKVIETPIKANIARCLTPLEDIPTKFQAVVVSVFDPCSFTIQLRSLQSVTDSLHRLLQSTATAVKPTSPNSLKVGYYAVLHGNKWHRAYMAVVKHPYRVFLVDEGYNVVVGQVAPLPSLAFMVPQMLAIRCTLTGVRPKDGGKYWSNETIEWFQKAVQDQIVHIERVGEIGVEKVGAGFPSIPCIRVHVRHPEHADIAQLLLDKGMAVNN